TGAAAACQADPGDGQARTLDVELFLDSDGLRVTGATAGDGRPELRSPSPGKLRFVHHADDGTVYRGTIPDFRYSKVEGPDHAAWTRETWGGGSVRVPDRDGELVLLEANGVTE